jgi:integral membrane protein
VRIAFLDKIESVRPFSEPEAWLIYKIAAFSEAIGWTFLIAAVLINKYHLPGQHFVVAIGGQIHGTFFLLYFGVLVATYTSLRWSRQKFIVAALAGVPPYGSLIFEQWAAYNRKYKQTSAYLCSIILSIVKS